MGYVTDDKLAEILGELVQPLLDSAKKDFEKSLTDQHTAQMAELAKAAETKEKPEPKETVKEDLDITDPEAVEKHLQKLRLEKAVADVDMTNPESVEAYLKTLKGEAVDEEQEEEEEEEVKPAVKKAAKKTLPQNQPVEEFDFLSKSQANGRDAERSAVMSRIAASINKTRGVASAQKGS